MKNLNPESIHESVSGLKIYILDCGSIYYQRVFRDGELDSELVFTGTLMMGLAKNACRWKKSGKRVEGKGRRSKR